MFQVLGFLKTFLKAFLGFSVQRRLDTKLAYDPGRAFHTPFSVTSFSRPINYNKTHRSRLEDEIKYDLYEIAQKLKPKNLK